MNVEPDAWLASVIGYPVFRITGTYSPSGISSETLLAHAEDDRAFYFIKVPVVRIDLVNALCNAGFRVVDVNVTFERKPEQNLSEPDSMIRIRKYRQSDEEIVLDIAGSCFVYSRFHLDPWIPKELADRIKREWIANYIRGLRGDDLFVAEFNGRPVGFNAVLNSTLWGSQIRVIDLIGVDRTFQRHGAGKQLLKDCIQNSFGRYSLIRVGTQIANIPSMRLYMQYGFSIAESAYILHAHVRNGEFVK